MADPVRILFLADSHLGTDLPLNPRVLRRRRGHDFLSNHALALAPALAGEVDLVVHGGDVFDLPKVSPQLARLAYEPLLRIADRGVPVFIVPGNHERGRLPHVRHLAHRHVHVFDTPRTYAVDVRGVRLALSGFPYERKVRGAFRQLVERTDWRSHPADHRLLCIHHCVEGATVGPGNFTFTSASDVIRGEDLPEQYAAVLSGHIHRHQVLTRDLAGRPLPAPVLYPGSIERTSTAEIGEQKGYLRLRLSSFGAGDPGWEFQPLPARPMLVRRLHCAGRSAAGLEAALRALIASVPEDAVLTVRVDGEPSEAHFSVLSSSRVRALAPPGMNVEVRPDTPFRAGAPRAGHPRPSPRSRSMTAENLALDL